MRGELVGTRSELHFETPILTVKCVSIVLFSLYSTKGGWGVWNNPNPYPNPKLRLGRQGGRRRQKKLNYSSSPSIEGEPATGLDCRKIAVHGEL